MGSEIIYIEEQVSVFSRFDNDEKDSLGAC